ncbi:MAG: fumarylacetoacetate hydrolase family protein [Candidatus Bathyarchaeia archaeon]
MIGKKVPTESPDLTCISTWVENKNWDSYCPMGPCVVTSDEIANPHIPPLHYECKVNDEIKQQGTSADLYYKVPQLIEIFSRVMTLEPGDVISTGTVKQQFPQRILQPGDLIETSIKEIGTIKNQCIAWKDAWK